MDTKAIKITLIKELKEIGITPDVCEKICKQGFLSYVNMLRDAQGLIASIREEFKNEDKLVTIEAWIQSTECKCETPFGTAFYDKIEYLDNKPANSDDYLHLFAVCSDDENMLKYVDWLVEKYKSDMEALKRTCGEQLESVGAKKFSLTSLKSDLLENFSKCMRF